MKDNFTSKSTVVINAPVSKVWEALTTPSQIKQYLFGTEVETDWKEGSPIIYRGIWEGKNYEDKGVIVKVIPDKLLETTYWSNLAGLPDSPENYKKVIYEISSDTDNSTTLTISNDNNSTQEEADRSGENWDIVLKLLKELLEK